MGIRAWLAKLRKREDADVMERAEEGLVETSEERGVMSGDIEGLKADEGAARVSGEASTDGTDRLGDN
jgi:hypothetical protein